MDLSISFLLTAAFFGTRYIGLDFTAKSFKSIGRLQKYHRLFIASTMEDLALKVERGLRLLPLPVRCLEQALTTWYLLNQHGFPATLKIGMSLTPLRSHAWVESGKRIFGDIAGLADFEVLAEYGEWTEGQRRHIDS